MPIVHCATQAEWKGYAVVLLLNALRDYTEGKATTPTGAAILHTFLPILGTLPEEKWPLLEKK